MTTRKRNSCNQLSKTWSNLAQRHKKHQHHKINIEGQDLSWTPFLKILRCQSLQKSRKMFQWPHPEVKHAQQVACLVKWELELSSKWSIHLLRWVLLAPMTSWVGKPQGLLLGHQQLEVWLTLSSLVWTVYPCNKTYLHWNLLIFKIEAASISMMEATILSEWIESTLTTDSYALVI